MKNTYINDKKNINENQSDFEEQKRREKSLVKKFAVAITASSILKKTTAEAIEPLYGVTLVDAKETVPYKMPSILLGLNVLLGLVVLLSKKFSKKSKIIIETILVTTGLGYFIYKVIIPVLKNGVNKVELVPEANNDMRESLFVYAIISFIGFMCMLIQSIITKDKSNKVLSAIWCLIFIVAFGILFTLHNGIVSP